MSGREFKVVLLGYQAVGKSSILHRYVKNTFDETQSSTIGAAFFSRTQKCKNGNIHKFLLWDTAGQERYAGLAPMYYRRAAAIIVVYDCTWESTLKEAERWIKEVKNYEPTALVALVANKCDLVDVVKRPPSAELVDIFCEASAKSNIGVSSLFENLADLFDKKEEISNSSPQRIELTENKETYCCS